VGPSGQLARKERIPATGSDVPPRSAVEAVIVMAIGRMGNPGRRVVRAAIIYARYGLATDHRRAVRGNTSMEVGNGFALTLSKVLIPSRKVRAMESELEKMYEEICDIKIAMMTTRRPDGHLVSRAMATQKRVAGADLWFVTSNADGSGKLSEIEGDSHVNLSYYKDRTREWVSVSGIATVSQDRAVIQQLWADDWKMWFSDEGDPRHGTPEDPRIVAIGVQVHSAVFLEVDQSQPVVLFEMVKGWVTGTAPDIGTMHRIGH